MIQCYPKAPPLPFLADVALNRPAPLRKISIVIPADDNQILSNPSPVMITPHFTVDQDEEFLHISVKISHTRFSAQSLEMVVAEDLFVFALPPYYLRLRLPGSVLDDERAKAEFISRIGCVKIALPKETKGQFFPDLDLTAKLLARKDENLANASKKPKIEELDISRNLSGSNSKGDGLHEIVNEARTHEWEISQELESETISQEATYGFNNMYSQIIGVSLANGNDINEASDPESCKSPDRIIERLIKENVKFDPEYYAADYIMEQHPSPDDDKVYSTIMKWVSPTTRQFLSWYKSQQQLPPGERDSVVFTEFSKEQEERMLSLPKRRYLISENYKPQVWMLLISLLFAHQFDLRENEGESNIESPWTIGKILPQFAALDSQIFLPGTSHISLLEATIITLTRRSLSYPFHRHFKLTQLAWNDVYYIVRSGRRVVLKCLLDLRELFRFHDVYYVYDKIWIEDLCSWILSDQVSENSLRQLAHDFKRTLDMLDKSKVIFEKIDDSSVNDELDAITIDELEKMALDSYAAYMEQT